MCIAGFDKEETEIICEAAAHAFADAEMFDKIAEYLDIADEELVKIRERLNDYLNGEKRDCCDGCKEPFSEDSIGGGRCTNCGRMIT